MTVWYIINAEGECWSNEHGWTGFDEATFFSEYDRNQTAYVPLGGTWERAEFHMQGATALLARSAAAALARVARAETAIEAAISALHNVPCVGEVYDQQHSDTHTRAVLMLQAALLPPKESPDAT